MRPFAAAFASASVPSGFGTPEAYVLLPLQVQPQGAEFWCWLATSVSVDNFYGGSSTQCRLADELLNQSTCCAFPGSIDCDQPGFAECALQRLGRHYLTHRLDGGCFGHGDIQHELQAGRPPVLQFRFNGGNDHVVVPIGAGRDARSEEFVRIGDPAVGWKQVDVSWRLAHLYRGGVSWKHVFRTSAVP